MSGWLTHVVAFLLGGAVGAVLVRWNAGRRTGAPDPRKILQRSFKDSPQFFEEIRRELEKPEFRDVREFAILESGRATFVSEELRFVFYEEDIPGLKAIAELLEENDFADDVTRGKTPVYRLRESFIDTLKSL